LASLSKLKCLFILRAICQYSSISLKLNLFFPSDITPTSFFSLHQVRFFSHARLNFSVGSEPLTLRSVISRWPLLVLDSSNISMSLLSGMGELVSLFLNYPWNIFFYKIPSAVDNAIGSILMIAKCVFINQTQFSAWKMKLFWSHLRILASRIHMMLPNEWSFLVTINYFSCLNTGSAMAKDSNPSRQPNKSHHCLRRTPYNMIALLAYPWLRLIEHCSR